MLLLVPCALLDALEVELLADAPFEALAESFAEPEVVESLAPLLAGLLNVEPIVAADVPLAPADALSFEPALLEAPLLVLPFVAEAVWVSVLPFPALALIVSFEPELELDVLTLFEPLEADDVSVLDAVLLELSLAAAFLVAVELAVSLLVLEEVSVAVELLEAL